MVVSGGAVDWADVEAKGIAPEEGIWRNGVQEEDASGLE
jgi:hypothetical protein